MNLKFDVKMNFCNITDKDIYLHPSGSNHDSGISGGSSHTRSEEHTFDDIPPCSKAPQGQIHSGYHHEITHTEEENIKQLPIPTEEKL